MNVYLYIYIINIQITLTYIMQTKTFILYAINPDTIYIYIYICIYIYIYIYIYISGGPLSALTCCVNVRLLSGDKKNIAVNLFSKLGWELGLYYASYDDFHPDILARMYT